MSFLNYQKQSPEILNNYLKYKTFILNESNTTSNEEYFDLRTLFRFIRLYIHDRNKLNTITKEEFKSIDIADIELDDFSKLSRFDIEQYIIFLKNTLENKPSSRNKKLSSAKNFFEYLECNHLIGINPTKDIKLAKTEKRVPKYLDINESKVMLAHTINSEQKFKIRNYTIICIFLNCSLRLSELTKIDLTDIKLDDSEQTLKVHGKGNKERIVYLDEAVCEAIKAYMEVRPKLDKDNPDHNALFLSSRYQRISNRAVQTIVKETLQEVIDEEKNPSEYHTHTLRHTGATLLYNENDVDILVLKKILGHSVLNSTKIYTHISDKKLKNIMETCTISSILEMKGDTENERIENATLC